MTRDEFMGKLDLALSHVKDNERRDTLDYYREMIDDLVESGLDEEEAVSRMEDVESIAASFVTEEISDSDKKKSALKTTLLILGSPIWISLLLAFLSCAFALLAALVAVAIALVVAEFAIGLSGAAMFIATIPIAIQNAASGAFVFGCGCILLGIAMLAYAPLRKLILKTLVLAKRIGCLFYQKFSLRKESL